MATDPPGDLELAPIDDDPRTLDEWLTMFHLVAVVLDPFTNESSWIIDTAGRVLGTYSGADCRPAFVVTGTASEARQFLGPWTDRLLTFADPDRELVKGLGLERLPALVHINLDGKLVGAAEGWDPRRWDPILANLSRVMSWSKPALPAPGDPSAYAGSAALG